MHKTITSIIGPIENKMQMGIHQDKSENSHFVPNNDRKNSVHPIPKLIGVVVQNLNRIARCVKMPTIPDWNYLAFDNGIE